MAYSIKIGYKNGWDFKGKSPAISAVRAAVSRKQRDEGLKLIEFEQANRCSSSTVHNWLSGKTKRPQFDKIAAVMDYMGLDIVFIEKKGRNR